MLHVEYVHMYTTAYAWEQRLYRNKDLRCVRLGRGVVTKATAPPNCAKSALVNSEKVRLMGTSHVGPMFKEKPRPEPPTFSMHLTQA